MLTGQVKILGAIPLGKGNQRIRNDNAPILSQL